MVTFKLPINQTFKDYNVNIFPPVNCSKEQELLICKTIFSSQNYSVRITRLYFQVETVAEDVFFLQFKGKNTFNIRYHNYYK